MAGERTFSAKQVARQLGTEAKTLRKFFRDPKSDYEPVGQGGRYDFPESEIPKIREAFVAWNAGKVKRNRPTNAERALAEKAGVIPKQAEKDKEATAPLRRKRTSSASSPLDEDDLMTRCRSTIGERARAKGLTTDKRGQWKLISPEEARATVPGLDRPPASEEEKKSLFDEALAEVLAEGESDE